MIGRLKHWFDFKRLRWRLSLAMIGVVLFTTVAIGLIVSAEYELLIKEYVKRLPIGIVEQIEKEVEKEIENGTFITNYPSELNFLFFAPAVVAIIVSLYLANRISKPLERIVTATTQLAQGDLTVRVALSQHQQQSSDETARLGQHFNAMAEGLARLEEERRITATTIAHELRTPLTILHSRLQALRDGIFVADEAEIEGLLLQTTLLTRLVNDLKILSLAEAGRLTLHKQSFDLIETINQVVQGFAERLQQHNKQLQLQLPPSCFIDGDNERLQQVLVNLLENALRHTPAGGAVLIELQQQDNTVLLLVRDTGPGIKAEIRHMVFARFVNDPQKGGMGLGLAIVKAIVELHGGTVGVNNHRQGGAQFWVRLPSITGPK
jgi:two-component system, OmpR family, sensor histidine kinase BaeS